MNKAKKLTLIALLISTNIILSRILAFRTAIVMVDFGFIPIILGAILLGPMYSILVASLGDIIGALVFPSGSYFVGFTITSALTGLVYGIFLKDADITKLTKKDKIKLLIGIVITNIVLNGILNTFWLMVILKKASYLLIPTRIAKQLIMIPVSYLTILNISKYYGNKLKKLASYD